MFRMQVAEQFQALGEQLRRDGQVEAWARDADPKLALVSFGIQLACGLAGLGTVQAMSGVNGPLLEVLAHLIQYHDRESIELLRNGGPLVS